MHAWSINSRLDIIFIIIGLVVSHSFCIYTATIDFDLGNGKVFPISMCADDPKFKVTHYLLNRSVLLISCFIFCLCLDKFWPVICLVLLVIQSNCPINYELVHYWWVYFATFYDYALNTHFLFECDYYLQWQNLVSVKVTIRIVLKNGLRGLYLIGRKLKNHGATIQTGKIVRVLDRRRIGLLKDEQLKHIVEYFGKEKK